MPRFVILEHDHPFVHWDLMLEAGAVLQTWRLAKAPSAGSGPIAATALGDHRVVYLDYEGPVSGDRGAVKRWDAGDFSDEPGSSSQIRMLLLKGTRLHARVCLQQVDAENWRLDWLNGC